jgi:thiamine-phosphate pyrophosphorylase
MTPRILLVTDPRYADAEIERVVVEVADAVPPGALGIQLRDKERDRTLVRVLAERLRVVSRARGALFVINGDVILAREVGADGVHLGGDAPAIEEAREAFPDAWISVAAHTDADVRRAAASAVDGVLVSPIFETRGKGPARGVAAIESAVRLARGRLAVYALGGVDAARAAACREAGADGVSVIRAIFESDDPGAQARAIWEALETRAPAPRLD